MTPHRVDPKEGLYQMTPHRVDPKEGLYQMMPHQMTPHRVDPKEGLYQMTPPQMKSYRNPSRSKALSVWKVASVRKVASFPTFVGVVSHQSLLHYSYCSKTQEHSGTDEYLVEDSTVLGSLHQEQVLSTPEKKVIHFVLVIQVVI
jgi:hypothetical protein